jgi:4-hydroxy-tetrahydrodipicolinate synthase
LLRSLGQPRYKDRRISGRPFVTDRTLRGVIAAVATIMDASGAPDHSRSLKLARFLLDNGCDGLNVLGTTGEATSFSREERMSLMSAYRTKKRGAPWIPLLASNETFAALEADVADLARRGGITSWLFT